MYNIIDGNKACADTAYLFSEIASIYPITPSSPMATEVDVISHTDRKNLFGDSVKVVEMQSEAGAAGALHGALITGSLATTFTASQGLLLMIPNMYKIAGECLPAVIHVAARTLASHALSIFGDHSDVYATRATGFCMLASTNVEDANMLAAVAHLSAIKGSLPFLHFFDGFRTSHEVNKVRELEDKDVLKLVDFKAIKKFKDRMLNVGAGIQKGMAENEDIFFQSVEARNELYDQMPDIVNDYMMEINKITGKDYKPFNYYGDKDAQRVIVAMGSVCDTAKLVVEDMVKNGEKVGLVEVHLYRPFSAKYLMNVLPKTVKKIAVLDRTKEAGSTGEPLYLDVCSVLRDTNIKVVGGRYGLSSKNTTPQQIYSVFKMLNTELKNNFTIGIVDDVTNLSLKEYPYDLNLGYQEIKIFGFGSDGMVSTSKDIMKLVGTNTEKFVQGYNQYDSKKSGGVTICNLRIADKPINAPFYATSPGMIVCTKSEYLFTFDMINDIKDEGIFVLNTNKTVDEINDFLPDKVKEIINKKHVKFYIIDADKIAIEAGIKGKISKIMQMVIMNLIEFPNALEMINHSIEKQFAAKGDEIINSNKLAITKALDNLVLVDKKLVVNNKKDEIVKDVIETINAREGDSLPVSRLVPFRDGTFPCSLTKKEKRRVSTQVPKWIPENCIQCGQCAIVCPHAVIRPFAVEDKSKGIPMLGKDGYNYVIEVSEADCLSCGLCINTCPGKAGNKALEYGPYDDAKQKEANEFFEHYENPKDLFPISTIKGSQFRKPKFEFSGSCAGCGETPYVKLLTQLLGDKLVIANATGCSSIYGGSAPSTPYSIPWANSLFEDNAEFGYGMLLSFNKTRDRIQSIMEANMDKVVPEIAKIFKEWIENREDFDKTMAIKEQLSKYDIPKELIDLLNYIPARSVWTLGGDGWAYDIGFGGIDHVLSSGENVNILVLDTEVYSNTGGQASKSSRIGQVAQFADAGKKTAKKDLFKIAMSYPNCYVANISLGSNFMQAIKAIQEAEAHEGPSIIIAYAPCIEQGIKGGMINSSQEQKLVVDCGYVSLMRYNPSEDKVYMDSREPDFSKYEELLNNEVRYSSLAKKNPEGAKEILELNKQEAMKRYEYYKKLSQEKSE
ncbi:MAG: pyruvate:ferredoxin (flavodoxin) oxidoreductase [Bacilli bacterium]|nr:pyruvate:ferredoxin (flavodoxin) oxidoreductase [Bacilli bacterium]